MSLYKKMLLLIFSIIFLILLITTTMMVGYQKKSIEVESDYNMTANMSIVVSQLDQTLDDFISLGSSFSNSREFTAYFNSLDLKDDEVINDALRILSKIKESSEMLNNVTLTPKDGVIRIDALGAFFEEGPDESQLEYFIKLSNNPELKSVINKPLMGTANQEPIFGIGIQMDNEGEFLGIIGLPINLNRLMERAVEPDITDEDLKVIMVNSGGTVVWATKKYQIHNEEINFQEQAPDLFTYMKENKNGSIQESILGIDAQIKFDYYEVFDTYIIIYKEIGPYRTRLIKSIVTTILLSIIIFVVSSFAVLAILKRIRDPIYRLVEYSSSVSNENFEIEISSDITQRKDEIGKLGRAYEIMINNLNTSFSNIQSSRERYLFLANHDELTNLPNRRSFNKRVQILIDENDYGSIIMMDIDNFKNINDTLGHIVGDQVLKGVGDVLNELSNAHIIVSRFGGDEFLVYINDNEENVYTKTYLSDIKNRFKKHMRIEGKEIDINLSMGLSRFPCNSSDLNELIRQTDIALYMAKRNGKNRVEYFDHSMEHLVVEKVNIEKVLAAALKNDGFKLVYQPQIDLETGETTCYEALLRLKNNRYYPDEFIKVAEENLQIIEIGRWVVKEAIGQVAAWRDEGKGTTKVCVNFSGVQLSDIGFSEFVEEMLHNYQVDGSLFELEVTENIFIQQGDKVARFFDKIASLGINLSIDDFGTGFSSLTYMISFPVNKIKLDRQLIIKYLHGNENNAIENLIALIHSLGYSIVAEGVEEFSDVKRLLDCQCDYIQGYYFSKPLDVDQIIDLGKKYPLQ